MKEKIIVFCWTKTTFFSFSENIMKKQKIQEFLIHSSTCKFLIKIYTLDMNLLYQNWSKLITFYRNSSSEDAFASNYNILINDKQLKTKPVCNTSANVTSILGEINNRTLFMCADKDTKETILKNSDEMTKWSCNRVTQYLDEIILGQYKQVIWNYYT